MKRHAKYLAILPGYNEAETIEQVIDSMRLHVPMFDILVIDDGSTDGTGEIAERAGAMVLRHPFNLGIGGAVQTGFVFAQERGYDYAVQVDADGQHCPEEITKLLKTMKDRKAWLYDTKRELMQCGGWLTNRLKELRR